MPLIMPIKDLRNTTEISNIAHKLQELTRLTKPSANPSRKLQTEQKQSMHR